ncbi:MAG: prepilin-type N-terminal cleavage/methylation domain-containing protein [Actinomycetia bacterium]|nr:prepilin-type N-terminal cleavage/methylation domain-containing protein [Actinomycetes bacterium]
MAMVSRRIRSDEGFTLTEMLVVTLLMGMVLGLVYMVMGAVNSSADTLEAKTIAADENRVVMDRITRELRQAQEIVDGHGVFLRAQPRQCAFYADVDHDGVPELIEYRVQGQTLYRSEARSTVSVPPYTFGSPSPEVVVAGSLDSGFTGNVFTYYDNEDPAHEVSSGHPEDISAVKLRLVSGKTVNRTTAFVDLSTWVKIRAVHNTID